MVPQNENILGNTNATNSNSFSNRNTRRKRIAQIKTEMKQRLKNERLNNRSTYLQTIKNLILQSMIKLLEPSLKVMVRKEDLNDIQNCLSDL